MSKSNIINNGPYTQERLSEYMEQIGLSVQTIETFGLTFCIQGTMKNRIVIPIHDRRGALVGHAGRGMPDTNTEKYIFSPGFDKSLELFNCHRALEQSGASPLVLVEGFFDVLKLYEYGARRVVALMGATLSNTQEKLIRQSISLTDKILIIFNEDDEGQNARNEIRARLSKLCSVQIHSLPESGNQPKDMQYEQVRDVLHF
jgi:DNA primase